MFPEHGGITVSNPTLLLPAVDSNTEEVLSGGSKVNKNVKEKRKAFQPL